MDYALRVSSEQISSIASISDVETCPMRMFGCIEFYRTVYR